VAIPYDEAMTTLDEIRARCDAATPGPWRASLDDRDHQGGVDFIRTDGADIFLSGFTIADYDFIAHARRDIELLLHNPRHPARDLIAARHAAATPAPYGGGRTVYAESADREFIDHCWADVQLLLAMR
jgi:hypothetical protein